MVQTSIRAGHATDLWRKATSDFGTPSHFCLSDIWRTLVVKTGAAWRAASDAVFSVTFFPVKVVGKMIKGLLHQRKCLQGSYGQESPGVRESPMIF